MTVKGDLAKASYQRWQGDEYNYYRSTSFKDYTIVGSATDLNAGIPESTEINIRLLPDGKVFFGGLFTTTDAIASGDVLFNLSIPSLEGEGFLFPTNVNGDTIGQILLLNGVVTAKTAIADGDNVATTTGIYIPGVG